MTDELRNRIRAMNPEPFGDASSEELADVLTVIEARRSSMPLDNAPSSTPSPTPVLRRPLIAMAGMALLIVLAVGVGVVISSGGDAPVGDTPTPTTLPPTTTPDAATPPEAVSSTTDATVTTTISPEASEAVMTWQLVSLPGSGEVKSVLAIESGLLAGGERDGAPMVWMSQDGETWSEAPPSSGVPDVTLDGAIQDITVGDELAVGVIGARVWYSTDFATWMPIDPGPFVAEGPVSLSAVTYGPAGFVVVGWVSQPDNDAMIDQAAVWHSPDGITWTLIEDSSFDRVLLDDVAFSGDRYVAVGLDWTPAPLHEGIWTSRDGQSWVPVETTDPVGGTSMAGITSTPDGMYAIGNYSPGLAMPEQDGDGCAAMWHSPDGDTWNRIAAPDDAVCDRDGAYGYSIAVDGSRIVGVGESHPKSFSTSQAGVWASRDLGVTWDRVDQPGDVFGVDANAFVVMSDITTFSGGYVAVGFYDESPAIWIGSWKE